MSYTPNVDNVIIAQGLQDGYTLVNKFGSNSDVDTGSTPEDLWSAGGLWVPPTTARTHDIASTSTADDGSPAGTGARTIRVYGLTAWNAAEVSEDITMNGTTNVATSNSYVIIHRMKVLTVGSGGTNAGTITATAQTDSTVTAEIPVGIGQTLMAIYGIPSTQTFIADRYYVNWQRDGGANEECSFAVLVNEAADQSDSPFLTKHTVGLFSGSTTYIDHDFNYTFFLTGPAIIKLRVTDTSVNNANVNGGFSGVLVDN